jgi:RNA polymerase sigma-70 factor (ECF subfamily)
MKNLDQPLLSALLTKIKKKDQSAFRELCLAYNTIIYRFVVLRLRDEFAAEEIVSDVLFQVWLHPERYDHSCQFSTWLLSIARHKLIDRQRAARPETEDIEDFADVLQSDAPDGFEALEKRQVADLLRACVEKLNTDHRVAINLVFYEGLSVGEAAIAETVPEGTMKTRLFHARQRLKACAQIRLSR